MHLEQSEFEKLMHDVRGGSEEAVRRLLDEYGSHIYRAVRRRLNKTLRVRVDSQDFVQAVWASFFAHRSRILEFDGPEQLIAFLGKVATNKVIEECRHHLTTQKNDMNRERRLEDSGLFTSQSLVNPGPSPSQVAIAREQWDRLLEGQPEHYQRIVELRSVGATYDEIALELGMNERNVRRFIHKLSQRLL
jgi:RNA polymerase sigma factor (sigma-70 family)